MLKHTTFLVVYDSTYHSSYVPWLDMRSMTLRSLAVGILLSCRNLPQSGYTSISGIALLVVSTFRVSFFLGSYHYRTCLRDALSSWVK